MIKLDWLGMRKYRNRIAVAVISSFVWGVVFGAEVLLPMLVWGMFDTSLYCFDAEEKGKLNQLYLTLPITRGTLITARYSMSLILQAIGIAAGIVLTIAFSAIMQGRTVIRLHTFSPSPQSMFLIICASLLFCAILSLAMHPILHKFGYAKAKIVGYVLPMYGSIALIVAFIILAPRIGAIGNIAQSVSQWVNGNIALAALAMLCAAALLLAASFALSHKLYAKREF